MKIAIIDDQEDIRYSVAKILKRNSHETYEFFGGEVELIETLKAEGIELIILDVMLELDKTGIDLLHLMREAKLPAAVILMTAFTTPENIIDASKLGVQDILQKPFEPQELLEMVDKYVQMNKKDSDGNLHALAEGGKKFIGSFETMKDIYKKIGIAANNHLSVLIHGETGTGKELVAELIHHNSPKYEEPFLAINCASVPGELFESQIFGHERGAFTSADKQHIGYAEQVGEGTLFLDEVGELEMPLQSKLLRFLENKTFRRVGGSKEIVFRGRIVTATNVNLQQAIVNHTFREDLFFRLSMLTITLPTLNERKKDIPLLVEHFIHLANKELGTAIKAIEKDALEELENHYWSGNIRQLRNTIYNAVLNAKQEIISKEDLIYMYTQTEGEDNLKEVIQQVIRKKGIKSIALIEKEVEKCLLESAVEQSSNITKLAECFGVSRLTLRKRLNSFGINYKKE